MKKILIGMGSWMRYKKTKADLDSGLCKSEGIKRNMIFLLKMSLKQLNKVFLLYDFR